MPEKAEQNTDVQEKTQDKDLPQEQPRFIDPNSGAAPQPGGFAHVMVETDDKSKEAEPAVDPVYDAEVEHSAGPAGKQPGNPDGVNANEAGQSEESEDPGEGKGGDAGDSQSGSSGESEGGQSQSAPKGRKSKS